MRARWSISPAVRGVLVEVARFLMVGGLATLVSFVGFNALAHGWLLPRAPMADQPVVAYLIANFAGAIVAYLGMRLWAFRDRTSQDTVRELLRFFGLGMLTLVIPVLFLWFSRYVLGLHSALADNLAANVIGLGIGTATRFWVFRQFVFRPPQPAPVPSGSGQGEG